MRTRRMQFGDVEATVVEGTPIGTICVAPVLLEEGVSLTHEERRLLDRKTRLLLELLQDEPFLAETESLYGGKLDLPPILVLFGRFPPDERGAGFLGRTRDREIDIEGVKLQVIELNLLEDDHRVRDSERKLVLWSGFLSLALCHSSRRPHEPGAVVDWSDAQAKRAWLLALRRGRRKPAADVSRALREPQRVPFSVETRAGTRSSWRVMGREVRLHTNASVALEQHSSLRRTSPGRGRRPCCGHPHRYNGREDRSTWEHRARWAWHLKRQGVPLFQQRELGVSARRRGSARETRAVLGSHRNVCRERVWVVYRIGSSASDGATAAPLIGTTPGRRLPHSWRRATSTYQRPSRPSRPATARPPRPPSAP